MIKKYKQFPLYISEEKFEELKTEADLRDMSINALIKSKLFKGVKNE